MTQSMITITGRITDNCQTGIMWNDIFPQAPTDQLSCLQQLGNKPIEELCKERNVLVFPDSFVNSQDGIEKSTVFDSDGEKCFTGNILGMIGVNKMSLHIASRFDEGESNFFLHYMLQKIMSVNIVDWKANTAQDPVWDFLLYMFPFALQNALKQGLYKEYRFYYRNDDNLKGAVDVSRHINRNVPFNGAIAYRQREHSFDNRVTQLIRHTIESIQGLPWAKRLLTANSCIKNAVAEIIEATPEYNRFASSKVIAQNLRSFAHPYYSSYQPLVKLCLQILRHDKMSYGSDDNQIYGILFDGAWLWEEFLASILCPNYTHPQNKKRLNRVYLYTNKSGECYPDFHGNKTVLDAKYKGLGRYGISREDRFQLISYLHVLKYEIGLLLYPTQEPSEKIRLEGILQGYGGRIGYAPFHVANCQESFQVFSQSMKKEEKLFLQSIQEWQQTETTE